MSRIRDELYVLADGVKPFDSYSCDAIKHVADRIDAEMAELPCDADGKPIHLGDTVYPCDDVALGYEVSRIEYGGSGVTVCMEATGVHTYRRPSVLTHKRPDSLGCIADDMGAEIQSLEVSRHDGDALDALRDYRDRIKALAEKEGGSDE